MHHDAQPATQSKGTRKNFTEAPADVLLLEGSKSAAHLKNTLDTPGQTLPTASRTELPSAGHTAPDNTRQPQPVANELRRYLAPRERKQHATRTKRHAPAPPPADHTHAPATGL